MWTSVAGTSEVALRLPSALFGIALVPVAYGIGRRLGGQRGAVRVLAALVAVNPLLVYYSQEARGYAAVALACAVGFGCFLDARGQAARCGGTWGSPPAVALGCHYFAIFPVAIEAAILLARRGRAVLPALGGLALAGAALLPPLSKQIGGGHSDNVTAGVGLAARVKAAATSWLVGERGAAIANFEWLVGALLLAGVVLVVVRRPRAAVLPAVVGSGAAALMAIAALGGADYLNNRNTLPALAIALAVPALRFAAGRAGAALGAAALAHGRRHRRRPHRSRARARGLAGRSARRRPGARRARGRASPLRRRAAALVPPGARAGAARGRGGARARRRPQRPRPQPAAGRRRLAHAPSPASPPQARAGTTAC